MVPGPAFPKGDILCNCGAISEPDNEHQSSTVNQTTDLSFQIFLALTCVCTCVFTIDSSQQPYQNLMLQMRKLRHRENKATCTGGAGGRNINKFRKFGSKPTLIIASLASSDIYASSQGSGMFLGLSISENDCWVANGGCRLVLKDQVLWERAHWQRLSGEAGGEGCGHRWPVPLAPRQSRSGSKVLLSARSAPRYLVW